MAKTLKDMVAERVEVVDNVIETPEGKRFNYRWLVPAAIVIVGACAFFIVRRILGTTEE
jgi:hypothetical protein